MKTTLWGAFPFIVISGIGWMLVASIIKSMGYPTYLSFGIFTVGVIANYVFYAHYIED